MNINLIAKCFLISFVFLSHLAFSQTIVTDGGAGLSPEDRQKIERMVRESKAEWDNSQNASSYNESDILSELGVEAHAKDGNQFEGDDIFNQSLSEGSTNGFMLRRQGSEKLLCESGAVAQLANLEVKVLECEKGQYRVAMCDAVSAGHNCSEHNTHVDTLDGTGSKQIFRNGVFSGAYQLESTCSVAACDIRYKAVYQQEFSSTSIGSKAQGEAAAVNHAASGSILNDVSAIYDPVDPELAKIRKDIQDNKSQHVDCYSERMNELNHDGKVRQSCDPSDVRTFDFLIDKREGNNFGKMMCERTEKGYCTQDIAIHERLDHEGEQVCTSQYQVSNQVCSVKLEAVTVENTLTDSGYSKRAASKASCGEQSVNGITYQCTKYKFNNYSVYGGGNIGNKTKANNYIFIPLNPRDVHSIKIRAPRIDDYLRVFVAPSKKNSGSYVLSTSDRWGTGKDYKNNSMGWRDITSAVKNTSSISHVSSFFINSSVWVVGSGEYNLELEIIYKKYNTIIKTTNNCESLDNRSPNSSSAAGCYQNNSLQGDCLDSTPRTIHGEVFNPGCWEYKKIYTCFDNLTSTCNAQQMQDYGWIKQREFNKEYPFSSIGQNTSNPWKWDEEWTYESTNGLDTSLGCAPAEYSSKQDATGGTINTTHTWCYKEPPKECHPSPPETEEEITKCRVNATECIKEENGLCVKQEQNYFCETAYTCEGAYGNSVGDTSEAPNNAGALAKVIAEGEKAKALSNALAGNMSEDDEGNITVFNGKLAQCSKFSSKFFDYMNWPINLPHFTAFSFLGGLDKDKRNCCVGLPEDIGTTVNAGNCDEDDIELAVKRLASAAHLIQLDGATPVATGNTLLGDDFQDASVAYGKKCHAINIDRLCTSRANDEAQTCLSYALDVKPAFNLLGYSGVQRWPEDSDLPIKKANLNNVLKQQHYFVESYRYGIPSKVCQNTLYDPGCGSGGCDRVIKKDEQNKDYFETEQCACEEIASDGSCISKPNQCRVYPNEEDIDLVGVDDVVEDGNWLPGRYEACAWWMNNSIPMMGMFSLPSNRGSQNASDILQKLALKPHVCKGYVWDVVDRVPVDHYQSWCTFDDPFARIIQEQGRKQLALYATRPETGSITDTVEFGFYTPITGSWTPAKIVNKQDVRFWQWPHSCTNAETATAANMTDQSCPQNADVYVAICEKEGKCGALPINPVLQASSKWHVRLLKAENEELQTLTPLLVLQGSCSDAGLCAYNIHAWQKGIGGSVDVPIDMNWALQGLNSGWKINYNSHNQIHLMAYTEPVEKSESDDVFDFEIGATKTPEELPAPKLKMCLGSPVTCNIDEAENDSVWETIVLDSPTAIDGQIINDPKQIIKTEVIPAYYDTNGVYHEEEVINTLKGGIRVKAFGQCSSETLNCAYRVVANIKLEAKPWHRGITYDRYRVGIKPKVFGKYIGGKKTQHYNHQLAADCSGFTLDQFLALNIAAMDLREFTDLVAKDAENKLQEMAGDNVLDVQIDANKITSGKSTSMASTGTKNLRLFPNNGYPGTEVKLQPLYTGDNRVLVTKNGMVIKHKVIGYTVDWGDGTQKQNYGVGQVAKHVYGDVKNKPQKSQTIVGSIIWDTAGGSISETFTYKLWVNPNEADGGGIIGAGNVPGTTSGKESLDSPIKQFNELDEDLRKLAPQNW
ncbi:conjugal transfer protein TraN [Marinospirillum insulare]|uniref:Conjugal transfer mating pair stabilization protein TraN n=1 Tax=Marinospirillum insulare TaxID=217169 RepID=A0ABQ6A121_9GAMM|nr:conjugal transfer protein TraN [Marinospirillum insulare]GLR63948.1 hypothetical protein GCM10007878_13860 [Marinospirillum insulare]